MRQELLEPRCCEDVTTTAKEDWRHSVTFEEDGVTFLVGRKRMGFHELDELLGGQVCSARLD
jgi:hypothetical protein